MPETIPGTPEQEAAPVAVPGAEPVAVTEAEPVPETEAEPVPETGPAPDAGPAPEAAPEAAPGSVPPAVPKAPRRTLRAALRWTSAVLVFAALGGAAAYGVTQPERTRIPGLKTPDDGRWTYPPLALPKLPAGKPRPLDDVANPGAHHYADIRSLLLPAPVGATADAGLPDRSGWLSTDAFLKTYDVEPDIAASEKLVLKDEGLRHIAAEGWTMPDGTRTEVYLLQFISAGYLVETVNGVQSLTVKGVGESDADGTVLSAAIPAAIVVNAYGETGADTGGTRYAYLRAGDAVALVVQSRPGTTAEVPFRQTVQLQAQLLG